MARCLSHFTAEESDCPRALRQLIDQQVGGIQKLIVPAAAARPLGGEQRYLERLNDRFCNTILHFKNVIELKPRTS